MKRIPKQEFTAEFKDLAVKRVRAGQTVGAVARELGLIEQTFRNWVKVALAPQSVCLVYEPFKIHGIAVCKK